MKSQMIFIFVSTINSGVSLTLKLPGTKSAVSIYNPLVVQNLSPFICY